MDLGIYKTKYTWFPRVSYTHFTSYQVLVQFMDKVKKLA